MKFPPELWNEIKVYAGIHSISTDWSFSYLYEGNWLQFYLELFHPNVEDIQDIRDGTDLKRIFFMHKFNHSVWKLFHKLNDLNKNNPLILPIIRNCNILLETEIQKIYRNQYDMFAIHIPYPLAESGREVDLIHNLHMLTVRCGLTRLFFCYEKEKDFQLILTVCI